MTRVLHHIESQRCESCGSRESVEPSRDVRGVAVPASCWRCRGEAERTCTGCDVALPEDYLADACLVCIAIEEGTPLPEDWREAACPVRGSL